jgi:murein tripeptide amidase MpaA
MPSIAFDRFYRYDDLTATVKALAVEHPDLVSIESIGKSHEGRDIWVLTVTRTTTGPATEKPAFWVDGNIHSTEVAASVAALYFLNTLVTEYGKDPEVTRALDTRAFYICPRVNPDGAEWALADKPKWVRSSTRPYPWDEDEIEGLTVEDVDGDGRILQMRIPDPNGLWKDHPEQPGLMVRREPIETGGRYYRILPEGTMEAWDGFMLRVKKNKQGLDLNRNFPANWRQEYEQLGAGPYPTSEPEVRAVVDFFVRHSNITGGVAFHTWAGVLLRPFDHLADSEMNAEDLWHYRRHRRQRHRAHRLSRDLVYEEFRYHPKEVIGGVFDWVYEHLGMYSWVVELLEPDARSRHHQLQVHRLVPRPSSQRRPEALPLERRQTGRPRAPFVEAVRSSPARPHRDRRLEPISCIRQPAADAARARGRALSQVAALAGADIAQNEILAARAEGLGNGHWRVRLVVQNTGWLPSYVSKRALERKVVRGVFAEIEVAAGGELVQGKRREELGQLEGKALQAYRRVVLARSQRHRRPRQDRMDRQRERRATTYGLLRGTSARERCA